MWRQMTAEDFWESAKPSQVLARSGPDGLPRWMTFNDNWVDEVRRGLKACAVFCWIPLWCTLLVLFLFWFFLILMNLQYTRAHI